MAKSKQVNGLGAFDPAALAADPAVRAAVLASLERGRKDGDPALVSVEYQAAGAEYAPGERAKTDGIIIRHPALRMIKLSLTAIKILYAPNTRSMVEDVLRRAGKAPAAQQVE